MLPYKSWSQAGQDLFVLEYLNYKTNGSFLEIGAFHSSNNSNTYLLETEFNWRGISFEINPLQCKEFNDNRKSFCFCADATQVDYRLLLNYTDLPLVIDYLQVDIDPASQSIKALELIMSTNYKFRTITFEHDLYAEPNNANIKQKQKDLLSSLGYVLYKENICWDLEQKDPFEDWWILP